MRLHSLLLPGAAGLFFAWAGATGPAAAGEAGLTVPSERFPSAVPAVHGQEVDASSSVSGGAPDLLVMEAGRTVPGLGQTVEDRALAALRGGDSWTENRNELDGVVSNNSADNVVTGANQVSGGAFSNAAGLNTVIQNSGANVLIQNATVVNVRFAEPGL
jgi:hypothetical protein